MPGGVYAGRARSGVITLNLEKIKKVPLSKNYKKIKKG
jgi:hypothetical protein